MKRLLVTGAGGFIGGHLVQRLLQSPGHEVRAADLKPIKDWYQYSEAAENLQLDLRDPGVTDSAVAGIDEIYHLAADMGGMGFIELNKSLCMLNVVLTTNLLEAARKHAVKKFFFASTACVYPVEMQASHEVIPLKESHAYPANPEDGYGWEKLFSERLCRHFREDFGIETRVARYHSVYGPFGTWDGGREKVPAAICRKVIEAKRSGDHQIEIWGDGSQTRSFQFIDDAVHGTRLIMDGDDPDPFNLGSSSLVSINDLVDIVEGIAGIQLKRTYRKDAPQGVRGRNSDNTRILQKFGWEPTISLQSGLEKTYRWIEQEMAEASPKEPFCGEHHR